MDNLVSGFHYLMAGFGLIAKPGLRRYVIIPLLINIALFVGLFFLLYHFTAEFSQWFEGFLPNWLQWLAVMLWLLFFISFFLLFIYTFVTVANVVAAPFNSLLAEKVELYLTGQMLVERSLFENIKDVPRIIVRQLLIIAYYLPRAAFVIILFFVPVVQAFAAILWFMLNAWFMTLTYLDYPTDNHRVSFQSMRDFAYQKRWASWGFGISVLLVSMVPILNFFAIPAAVAGATKYWVEANQ